MTRKKHTSINQQVRLLHIKHTQQSIIEPQPVYTPQQTQKLNTTRSPPPNATPRKQKTSERARKQSMRVNKTNIPQYNNNQTCNPYDLPQRLNKKTKRTKTEN